jgi:predicted secreted protein
MLPFAVALRRVSRRGWAVAGLSAMLLATIGCAEPTSTDALDPNPTEPVPPGADLSDTLAISPQNAQALPGQQVVFTAPAQTVNGTPVTGAVTWTASGGTIDSNGVFMALSSGTYTVSADRGNKKGRGKVTVSSSGQTITSVTISPKQLGMQTGTKYKFAATGTASSGNTVPVAVTWSATGGAIDTSGT